MGDPEALETGMEGIQRTSIYYCDPMRSGKRRCGATHIMLRIVLPNGISQEKVLMADHLKTLR